MEGAQAARAAGADLDLGAEVATSQRLTGLVWRVLQDWDDGNATWSGRLKEDVKRCRAQALLVMPRLGPLLFDPLSEAGLRPMPIKGAALAERYPAPGLRPMDDVDLLFGRGTRAAAIDALADAGWSVLPRRHQDYSVAMANPALPGLPLDLHEDLALPGEHAFRLTGPDLWQARRDTTISGSAVFGLPPEWEILLTATHAAKRFHTFDRLVWSVDAAVIIGDAAMRGEPVDWEMLHDLARRASARSAVAVLLTQASRLGAPSPDWIRVLRGSSPRRHMLEPLVQPEWALHTLDDPTRHRLAYALIDSPMLEARRAVREAAQGGPVRAPFRGLSMAVKILRRSWRLSRGKLD